MCNRWSTIDDRSSSWFINFLKKAVPGVLTVHCVNHRQLLVAKHLSGRLHKSMSTVITAINKIKAHALNSRLFQQLCNGNDEEFKRLLLHTEVRWLSKGNCQRRFYSLFDKVVEFFQDSNSVLCDELRNIKHDIAYLSDVLTKFNELICSCKEMIFIKVKSAISIFLRTKIKQRCVFACVYEGEGASNPPGSQGGAILEKFGNHWYRSLYPR